MNISQAKVEKMTFTNLDHTSLNALQKMTLRAVVMSFLFYGLAILSWMPL
jgi:hypothetical protein